MRCPNCDEHFELDDYDDQAPFQCEHCDHWLRLDLDEGTYEGAVKRTLVMLDGEGLS